MSELRQEEIVVADVRHKDQCTKRLFANSHLELMNKAILRRRGRKPLTFFWFPGCQHTPLWTNHWAQEAVYMHDAEVLNTCGWTIGDDIRGPVIVKKQSMLMPSIEIGWSSSRDTDKLEVAKATMNGFWQVLESPVSKDRQFFAESRSDLLRGRMIFGY